MLYLESFVHRVELAEVVSRWVVNRPDPEDVATLKKIVNFNSYISRLWVHHLFTQLLTELYGQPPKSFIAKTKGEIKDFVVRTPLYTNERIEELFAIYRTFSEDYYRETPFDGRVYYNEVGGHPQYVGSSRIKRFRRIAEKGSRRIVDYMFERIRANADALAEERAKRLGIPKHQLITPQEEQVAEFLDAERRLLKMIRRGTIQAEFPILSIPDVVGIKVIAEGDQFERLIRALEANPSCSLLEQEHHTGRYNAINLRVAHMIPRALLAATPPAGENLKVLASRGFDPDKLVQTYHEFLDSAEDHVLLEIIVSSYQDFLESEIGRSMHEDRILEQRSNREYNAHLATSVFYLMDYILALCLSPRVEPVADVPIKLWVKYMPDTMDRLLRGLFNMPTDASFEVASPDWSESPPPILGGVSLVS
ncbi:MAG: hypothetical protein IT371_00975 [Deltaproteobacteria bacterium]|nr:hypothetical protein [Deltaproteobacteria bacterium]